LLTVPSSGLIAFLSLRRETTAVAADVIDFRDRSAKRSEPFSEDAAPP